MIFRPNKSPEPTAVDACRSAIAVHVASRRWLSFFRWLIMRSAFFIILAALLVGCATTKQPDPIDQLVTRLSSSGVWMNGVSPKIDMPPSASAEQIVKIVLEQEVGPNIARVTSYKILDARPVHFSGLNLNFTAALVQTNVGQKIVLFTNFGADFHFRWWSRVYDTKSHQPNHQRIELAGAQRSADSIRC